MTPPANDGQIEGTVHPHGCGEHNLIGKTNFNSRGSSPRVWGTRITMPPRIHSDAVHPHGCGEHFCSASANCWAYGSSPRVWGTFNTEFKEVGGSSSVHPHGCGEHTCLKLDVESSESVHPHGCGEHAVSAT